MIRPNRRSVLTLAGAVSLAGAAVSAEIAWLHMRWLAQTYGVVCGLDGLPHCAACPTAVGLLGAGLAFLAAAARRPGTARVRPGAR